MDKISVNNAPFIPNQVDIINKTFTKGDTYTIDLEPGGGQAIQLVRVKS